MFDNFSKRNRERSESLAGFNHSLNSWTLSDWCTSVCGELGEAANVIKKLKRIEDGIPGNKEHETKEFLESELADELADTYMYLDLLAQAANIDLKQAVLSKFDRVSKKLGYVE